MIRNTINVKIDNFEGPLDLLMHLTEIKKMYIHKINISQIIDDYLEYIHSQKEKNLRIKVEFLSMATDLVEIKAYSVLNENKKTEKAENLEKKILEYKLFKEIAQLFAEKENEYNISHLRMGNQNFGDKIVEYDISSLTLENLIASFQNILNPKDMKKYVQENMKLNLEEEYTAEEAHLEITENIKNKRKVPFSHLLKNKFSKIRIVTMFLCILDMFKNGEIDIIIDQNSFFVTKIM